MINPATRARQQYYGVNSTPSTFFDGARKASGGGGQAGAEGKYKEYLAEINPFEGRAGGLLTRSRPSATATKSRST